MDDMDKVYTYVSVVDCANKILELEANLKSNHHAMVEIDDINESIKKYTDHIDKYTNNSSKHIISCVQKLNQARNHLNTESNPQKIEMLNNWISKYEDEIRKKIVVQNRENTKQDSNISKQKFFRNCQHVNYDALKQAHMLSELLLTPHQEELRSKPTKNEGSPR